MRVVIDKIIQSKIIEQYQNNKITAIQLSKEMNIPTHLIYRILHKHNIIIKQWSNSSKVTEIQKIEIIEKYKTGNYNCQELAIEYKVARQNIRKILLKNNIKIYNNQSKLQRKYDLDEYYFDTIDTEEKAYFLGLLYADGCNSRNSNKISIGLQEDDREILEKLKLAINCTNELIFQNRKLKKIKWKNIYSLSFNSNIMSQQLTKLGCTPRKSLTLQFPTEEQCPKHLLRHWLRGLWDGDGSINYSLRKHGKSYEIRANIVSTEIVCKNIQNYLQQIPVNCCIYKPNKKGNSITKKLTISGNIQCLRFLNWLYKDSNIYLQRKYDKYQICKMLKTKVTK